jgi:hypothetical protein
VVNPIHHLYRHECMPHLEAQLREHFDIEPVGACDPAFIAEMVSQRRLALLDAYGHGSWLTPKPHAFDHVRDLDASRLEHLERGCMAHKVFCQQGLGEVRQTLANGGAEAVILTRPASLADVTRSGCEGVLMPPWTTSFAPKPLTGIVIRDLTMA